MTERKGLPTGAIKEKAAAAEVGKGNISSGISSFISKLVLFVIVPLVLIEVFCWIGGRSSSGGAPAFVSALRSLGPGLAIVGSPLAIVAGFWGYHLRRTQARMLFGILLALMYAIYAAVLFLSGPFAAAVSALGWVFPALLAFGVGICMSLLVAFRSIREYLIFSDDAKKKQEERGSYYPSKGWGEFDLRAGNAASGVAEATAFIKKVINRPVLFLLFFMCLESALTFGQKPAETQFLNVLSAMAGVFLLFGIPLTTLVFLKGYYPKGSRPRSVFDLAASLLFVLMIFWIFIWSGLPDFFSAEGLTIPIGLMALAVAIWAFVDVLRVGAEYYEERPEWLKRAGYEVAPRKKKYLGFKPGSRLYDFNLALGKLSRGLKGAKKDIFRFVTLPEIVILMAIGFLDSVKATGPIYDILHQWSITILIFGLLVAFVSFWRAYYPQGSWSRLTMGLLMVPALILWIFGLGLGGGFQQALLELGIALYMPGVEMLLIILVVFAAFRQVAEFGDHHYSWLVACGKEVKPIKPIEKMTRVQEFRPRFGSRHNGVVWIGKGMVRYVFYTSIFLIFLITMIDSAIFAFYGYDLTPLASGLSSAFLGLLLIAIPLAAFRGLYGFYPAGSTSRLTAGYLMGATGATYTYTAFNGGTIMMGTTSESLTAGLYISFGFIVVLFFIGWLIWAFFVTMEYVGYRQAWIDGGYSYPVDVDERLRFQKLIDKEERREEKQEEREQRRARGKAHRTSVDSAGNVILEEDSHPRPDNGRAEEDEEEE